MSIREIETLIDSEQSKNRANGKGKSGHAMSPALHALLHNTGSPARKAMKPSSPMTPTGDKPPSSRSSSIPELQLGNSAVDSEAKAKAAKIEERKRRAAERKAEKAGKAEAARQRKAANKAAQSIAAAKKTKNKGKGGDNNNNSRNESKSRSNVTPKSIRFDDPFVFAKHLKDSVNQRNAQADKNKQKGLFSHLAEYEKETSLSLQVGFSPEGIHPAILRVGLHFTSGHIVGTNARCVAMMEAFKEFISDYEAPPDKAISRDLNIKLKPLIRFLEECRTKSISMGSAIMYLKSQIIKIPNDMSAQEAKTLLIGAIDDFIKVRITMADEVIAVTAAEKIQDGDVILTFAKSTVIEAVLKRVHDEGKRIRVVIVDSDPRFEGKILLTSLLDYGMECTYMLLNAVAYVMKDVTKVLLGANAMLANGTLMSRVGSAVVAMLAHRSNRPVLVCCETYKLSERVQVDAITNNEMGDPDALALNNGGSFSMARTGLLNEEKTLFAWRDVEGLSLLNLTYDLVPAKFLSMVVTEIGVIPPTSVPVVVREYHEDLH